MKKTFFSIIFILILSFVPTMAFATEEDVAKVGEQTYATFEEALDVAKETGEKLVILETLYIGKNPTFNIEGVNITGEVGANPLFFIEDGFVTFEGNGTISAPNGDAFSLLGNTDSNYETVAINSELKIGADVKITARDNCVYLKGNGAKVDVYGSLMSTKYGCAVIQGNGNEESGKTVINIYDGANVVHNDGDVGIYHPQAGKLNVYGGTIKGATGIEMRSGELIVEDGTIIGTAVPVEVTPNGNGSTSYGAGIAIAQHSTKLNTNVVVNGGTIQGYSALYESNPENNDAESISKVSIAINGGNFETLNGGTISVYSENKTDFIKGGTFSSEVMNYIPDYYVCNQSGNNYIVQKLHDITVNVKDFVGGTADSDVIRAVEGRKVGLYITPDEGYELKEVIIIDALGVQTRTTNHYFTMPNSDVTVEVVFKKITQQEVQIPSEVEDTEEVQDVLLESLKQNSNFKEVVENNNVKVEVQVSEEKVQQAEKEEIQDKLEKNGLTAGKYFDITIAVINKDTGITEGTLNELTQSIGFTIQIPENLLKVTEGFTRRYYILRNHIGEMEYLEAELSEDGKSLSFETDRFSTYVLGYSDVKNPDDNIEDDNDPEEIPGDDGDSDEQPGDKDLSTGMPGETIEQPKEETDTEEPKVEKEEDTDNIPNTGDNIILYVLSAIAALTGIVILKKVNSKKNKN